MKSTNANRNIAVIGAVLVIMGGLLASPIVDWLPIQLSMAPEDLWLAIQNSLGLVPGHLKLVPTAERYIPANYFLAGVLLALGVLFIVLALCRPLSNGRKMS